MPEKTSPGAPLEAPLPDHIQLSHDGANLVLEIRWFRPYHLFMLLFTVFWSGFLVFWYSMALRQPSPKLPRGDDETRRQPPFPLPVVSFSRAVWPGAATKASAIQAAIWQPRGDQLTDGFEDEDVLSEVGAGMKLRWASVPLARQP